MSHDIAETNTEAGPQTSDHGRPRGASDVAVLKCERPGVENNEGVFAQTLEDI